MPMYVCPKFPAKRAASLRTVLALPVNLFCNNMNFLQISFVHLAFGRKMLYTVFIIFSISTLEE